MSHDRIESNSQRLRLTVTANRTVAPFLLVSVAHQ